MRVVGDVHGWHGSYWEKVKNCEYSLQIGDFGFNYRILNTVDSNKHKIIPGNHEHYDNIKKHPHFLPTYGMEDFAGMPFFYVRGGESIDKNQRVVGFDWFENEQLDMKTLNAAIEMYKQVKPTLVITHECPASIIPHVSKRTHWDNVKLSPSRTAQALQAMLEIHEPDAWIFGHHHFDLTKIVEKTTFICLGELSYMDIPASVDNWEALQVVKHIDP